MNMTTWRESTHESNMYDHTVRSCTDPELALLCKAVLRECFERKLVDQDSVADLFGAFHDDRESSRTAKTNAGRLAYDLSDD